MKTRFVYPPKSTHNSKLSQTAFTIVELLVVIVVIAILAAITIVSYTGITSKATASALQSDLDNASRQLKLYQVENGTYPTSLPLDSGTTYCPIPTDTRYCVKASNGNTFTYTNLLGTSFKLIATKDTTSYYITSDTSPNNKNLLYLMAGDSASFEDGTTGTWGVPYGTVNGTLANSAAQYYHGTKSLAMTTTANGNSYSIFNLTALTSGGSQYTASAWFKGIAGKQYSIEMYGNIGGIGGTAVTADGTWQRMSCTYTYSAGTIFRVMSAKGVALIADNVSFFDAIQLESGSVATPF